MIRGREAPPAENSCNVLGRGWVGEEQSLASIDHRGNNNSGTRTVRVRMNRERCIDCLHCSLGLHVRGPRLHRRDDASPDGSRGGSIQFANEYRGEGRKGWDGRVARVLVWDFFSFFPPPPPLFLKGRPTMIGNERLEDESNASPTLTEAISRSIRGINGSRMEYGVRILYIDTYGLFLFSFSMNFTEGGR